MSCCRYLMAKEPAAQKKTACDFSQAVFDFNFALSLIQLQVLEPLQLQKPQLPQQEQQLA